MFVDGTGNSPKKKKKKKKKNQISKIVVIDPWFFGIVYL